MIRDRHSLGSDKLGYKHVHSEGLNQPFGGNCRQLWRGSTRGGQSCLWTVIRGESKAVKEKQTNQINGKTKKLKKYGNGLTNRITAYKLFTVCLL